MTPEFPYVQLPGTFRGFLRKASLWEGADHVLSVKGTRFNEEYRRFYYRDIQAFIIEKRAQAGSIGLWTVLLTALVIALIAAAENSPPYSWIAALILLAAVLVRLNLTWRRSCRCSIQTAVSREPLPSLIRLTAASAVADRLRTRIAAVQGELPAEIPPIDEAVWAAIGPADAGAAAAETMLDQAGRRERRFAAARGTTIAVVALFILLLNCVFTFWFTTPRQDLPLAATSWIAYSFIVAELIAVFISMRHIDGIPALNSLHNFMIALIILCALRFSLGLAMTGIYTAIARTQGSGGIRIFARYYSNIGGALQLAFAAAGLILIFAKWETYRRGDSSSN